MSKLENFKIQIRPNIFDQIQTVSSTIKIKVESSKFTIILNFKLQNFDPWNSKSYISKVEVNIPRFSSLCRYCRWYTYSNGAVRWAGAKSVSNKSCWCQQFENTIDTSPSSLHTKKLSSRVVVTMWKVWRCPDFVFELSANVSCCSQLTRHHHSSMFCFCGSAETRFE